MIAENPVTKSVTLYYLPAESDALQNKRYVTLSLEKAAHIKNFISMVWAEELQSGFLVDRFLHARFRGPGIPKFVWKLLGRKTTSNICYVYSWQEVLKVLEAKQEELLQKEAAAKRMKLEAARNHVF